MAGEQMFSDGKAYERLMGRWSRLAAEQFIPWIGVPPASRWVDVGCGNGAFTQTLMERCAPSAVSAIDPSEGQIAYARTRAGTELAKFQVGDAQSLPYDDDDFDAGVMALVIAFVPDPAKAVAEMARVVRPGGVVAAYMWDVLNGGTPIAPLYAAMKSLGAAPAMPPTADASRREAMMAYWQNAGLHDVESEVIRITVSFDDLEDCWESCSLPSGPMGLAIRAMSAEQRDDLREALRSQVTPDANGRIAYQAFANAVKGRVSK